MSSQMCYFSSRSRRIGNPNHSTPWGRYRHGCDPPACGGRSNVRGPTCTSVQPSRRFVHHIAFPSFSHSSSFQNIHQRHKPQSSFPFRETFLIGQTRHRISSLLCKGEEALIILFFTEGRDIPHPEERTSDSHIKSQEDHHARYTGQEWPSRPMRPIDAQPMEEMEDTHSGDPAAIHSPYGAYPRGSNGGTPTTHYLSG